MAIEYIDGIRMYRSLSVGLKKVISRQDYLNKINVFPVPDGDTGTNMHLTLKDLDKIIETPTRLPDFLKDIAHTTLMGARGNSGVILSQFFKALLNSYEKTGSLTINSFFKN